MQTNFMKINQFNKKNEEIGYLKNVKNFEYNNV